MQHYPVPSGYTGWFLRLCRKITEKYSRSYSFFCSFSRKRADCPYIRLWKVFAQRWLGIDTREFPHGIAIVNSILGGWVWQFEPELKQIHPQHFLNPHGRTTTLSRGVVGLDPVYPLLLGNDLIHNFQKFLPLGFLLAEAILDVCKCFLLHFACTTIVLMVLLYHIANINGSGHYSEVP